VTRLALQGVSCLRGGRLLFEDLNLTLEPGEGVLVTGANGVGKSSLLRIAAGLLAPAAGCVVREGAVALSAEAAALDEDKSLFAALHFWAGLDGGGDEAVAQALAAIGLAPLAEVPVRLLSTGQRRRATLARVIASGAGIWLLDEPASGLDAGALGELSAVMAGHLASGGVILAASHQPLGIQMRELAL
jgi:heme exporter protein A